MTEELYPSHAVWDLTLGIAFAHPYRCDIFIDREYVGTTPNAVVRHFVFQSFFRHYYIDWYAAYFCFGYD
jgi:hypothetical protein